MIPLPQKPKIVARESNRGVIEIEGLYPGYGLTLGNALRRVLLSSLAGAAATSVKIAGVRHEFSTLPGVLEDIVEIALNLKQIRFRLYGEDAERIVLSKRGVGEARAGDFNTPSQVEIVNPDQHIATLTDRGTGFDLEVLVERGIGYQPVEERKLDKLPIGEIALDAIFTPIKKVAVEVENMRMGERTDYNRLRVIIETDGTVTPEEAFGQATEVLVSQFQALAEVSAQVNVPETAFVPADARPQTAEAPKEILKQRVEEIGVNARVSNALIRAGIKTVGGLVHRTEASLLGLDGLGEGSVKEIRKELGKLGLTLKK